MKDKGRPIHEGMKLPRIKFGRPQQTGCAAAAGFSRGVPLGRQPAAALAAGLSLRRVWARDVGAAFAAGRLLYHLRQPERRRNLCLSCGRASADRAAAGDARRGQASQTGESALCAGLTQWIDMGGAARALQREVPSASAVYLLRRLAGRRTVVGLAAALWQ